MLIRRAVLRDAAQGAQAVDIRVSARIDEVGPGLTAGPGEPEFDAAGGLVLPGLHDHHLHVRAAASALASVFVGPPAVRTADQLAEALSGAAPDADGWVRAVGYHQSVAGELDRAALDALLPGIALRVQHRSGALWILNSAGLGRAGLADHPDGRLRSADWSPALPRREADLAGLGSSLVAAGVTGVTDATPDLGADDMAALRGAHRRGEFAPRLHFLSPGKKILHDDRLDPDALSAWIAALHAAGRPVAVHCVTVAQLVVAIAALRTAGGHPGDRIEHAAAVPDDLLADLAELAVTVVTQPNFVAERGDEYLADVPAAEHGELWRLASLLDAGVRVALSTDAPFGCSDPWAVMHAAVHRTTPAGAVLNAAECITAPTALSLFLGHAEEPATPRRIEPGQPGDLCVLTLPPVAALARLAAGTTTGVVAATIIGGEIAYNAT